MRSPIHRRITSDIDRPLRSASSCRNCAWAGSSNSCVRCIHLHHTPTQQNEQLITDFHDPGGSADMENMTEPRLPSPLEVLSSFQERIPVPERIRVLLI